MSRLTVEERFWSKVYKTKTCWLWTATKDSSGYGRFRVSTKLVGSHRLSYEWAYGSIKPGFVVMHSCDTPACVNPKHLSLGTHADNMADMSNKGRGRNWCTGVTKCKNGHEFNPENIYHYDGKRLCRACRKARGVAFRAKQKPK